VNHAIVYEHPLNERIRTFLRLEYLFSHLGSALGGDSIWESRVAISTLIEIMGVFGRTELKSDLLKELEKQSSTLKRLENAPNVDGELVKNLVRELDALVDRVYSMEGQIGSSLRQSELLKSIMQRSSIPGGTCDFDLPAYHFWLQQPAPQRQAHLRAWSGTLDPVRDSIMMILRLLRESAAPQDEVATGGIMQKTLDANVAFQLLRVFVPGELPCYTEVSGSKHRFSIRFMEFLPNERARQTDRDVHFKLSCCVL
jgi:cell division protein ZapD